MALDITAVRARFPGLDQEVNGKPLVYLDNGATSQKPDVVLKAIADHYQEDCSNVHRGVHALSQRATTAMEAGRETVRRFLNARETSECIFVRGTTEGINLVANTLGQGLGAGDEILVTRMEHHSNIVPWQLLCERTGATLKVAEINERGEIIMEDLKAKLSERTRLVSVVHVSNSLGTVNPVEEITELAHGVGARVLLDGAQAAVHMPVDVQALDCDLYVFSGHKTYGPTGIGVLYGKHEFLAQLPPWEGGGDMIRSVSFEGTTYSEPPSRFEAGTPNIAGIIGLGAALEFLMELGLDEVSRYEAELLAYGHERLREIDGLHLVGTAREKASILGFTMDCAHPHDIGTILDQEGVAVRAGHHCCQPAMEHFGVPATARASLGLYNTREDIDRLVSALQTVLRLFA
ncbi:MAG: cysteine desulfurase [Myxococcota bacterium]|nr:cysteine desulfurase [Myxococcota bacterium]